MVNLFFEKSVLFSIIASSEVLMTYLLDDYLDKNLSYLDKGHKNLIRFVSIFIVIFILTLVLMYTIKHFFGIKNP